MALQTDWVHVIQKMKFGESPSNFFLFKINHYLNHNKIIHTRKSLKIRVCAQQCLILYDPMDCKPSCCSVHGISQARILERVVISFSRGSSQPRDQTQVSCVGRQILTTGSPLEIRPEGKC